MDDVQLYRILVRGNLAVEDIESFAPAGFELEQMEGKNTCLFIRTDQSGIVGLIRHLHGIGCVLLFFERNENDER